MKPQIYFRVLLCLLAVTLAFGLSAAPANVVLADAPAARPAAAYPDIDEIGPGGAALGRAAESTLQSPLFRTLGSSDSCTAVFWAGGDRLAALQNDDGGWDWPLDNGDPTTSSPPNTIGPIGMGLGHAYLHTGDPNHLGALQQAGTFLLSKTNNFSPSDGYLAAQLDRILGGTAYVDHLTAHFYGPLAAGTYDRNGAGTLYDTAGYVALIRTARAAQGIPNLAAWDVGMGLVGAASAGADTTAWIDGVKAEINELDGNAHYDVIGLAGAVYGLAFVGADFDPTDGQHAAASDLDGLAAILAGYQIVGGGFTWNMGYLTVGNETIQETAYAVLALNEVDQALYLSAIQGAADYIKSVQLATGGWENYVGSPSGENNEVTGEALWGVSVALPGPVLVTSQVVADPNPTPVNGVVSLQAAVDNATTECWAIAFGDYSLNGGAWQAMAAEDGTFDEVSEDVTVDFDAPGTAGIYDLCVRGTDGAGNTGPAECTMLVVYDPDGGFVTGGGWIDSPAGAMPPAVATVTISGYSGNTSVDPAAAYAPYYLRYVGDPPPAGYDPSHNYQWASPAIFTPSPEDGPVTLSGSIDVDEQTVGQVAMIGLLDRDDLAAGNSSFQRGAYIYIYRASSTSWKIGLSDGNVGGEIVQTFITLADTDLPSDGMLDVEFTVDGTADGTTCAAGPHTAPAGCMVLQITGGSVSATLTDSYGDIVGTNSASPEFTNGAVPGWDDYLGSNVGYTLAVPSTTGGSAEGRATFGFVAKYNKKTQEPEGNTEFQFKAGDINFHSSSYEWLVVNKGDSRAQFKGTGTINGGSEYKFILWATDDDTDTFRIKIWEEDEGVESVVYDNGFEGSGYENGQPIGGGNIVVHTK